MNPTNETEAPEKAEELAKYELMLIFKPDMSQEETDKELNKVKKLLKDQKAEIFHQDVWDIRDLAYVIKKNDKGYYVILYFTMEGVHLAEIEKELRLNAKIIRHLVVKSPKNYELKKLEELMAPSTERRGKPKEEAPKRAPRKVAKKEETKVKEPEVVEEKPVEKPAEKPAPKMDISDLDSKLESILDDPDIDIKL
jgi:small subunit ribosomal protein S6